MRLKHRKPVLKAFTYTCATILLKPYLHGAHLIFFAFYKRMLFLQYFSFLCTSRGDRFDHFLLAFIDQCLYLLECGIYLIYAVLLCCIQSLKFSTDPILCLRQLQKVKICVKVENCALNQ